MLGSVEAHDSGHLVDLGPARQRGVLAVLLVHANHPVPADQFLDHVWGEHLPQRGRDALYSYLSRLRAILASMSDVSLQRSSTGYRLVVDEAAVDVHRFRQLVTQARSCADDSEALVLFDRALALWRGTALAELDSPWFVAVRTALEAERRTAELDRADAALRCGRHAELLAELSTRAAQHPLDERLAGQVMLALYRSGRQADALHHYQRVREELAEQLGAAPEPALQQLHQSILTADDALAAPVTTSKITPRQLPPAPTGFTGRDAELDTLTGALDTADGATVLISGLAGAGGIGKTWLGLHWAHTHAERFPDGQLFVDLRGFSPDGEPVDPLTALRGFLDGLGVDTKGVFGGLAEHTARYRSELAGKKILVVLDNAATADQVVPLLPGTPSCTVLVTSRKILTPLVVRHNAGSLNLDVLSSAEAHALLAGRLGTDRVAAEPDAVAELIRLCGGYPLALSVIAGRAQAHPHLPLADFTTDLRAFGIDALDDADVSISLPAVLSWSLHGLTAQQRTAFALLGIAPGPDIGLAAAATLCGLPPVRMREILRHLVEASLVERRANDRYAMHDLMRAYAVSITREEVDEQTQDAALRRVLTFYSHTAHAADRLLDPHRPPIRLGPPAHGVQPQPLHDVSEAVAWFDTEHSVLLAAQRAAARHKWHLIVWQLAWTVDTFHNWRGDRHAKLATWQPALDAAEHLPEPVPGIYAHRRLGAVHAELGHHEEGISQLRQALALAEVHQDPLQLAATHRVLARAWARDDARQALDHAAQALDLFRVVGQPVWEADALNAVGWYAARVGQYDRARDHCQAALTLNRRHHNPEAEANTLDSLGYIAHHRGDHQESVSFYRQALTLFHDLGNAYEAANTLDNLGFPHVASGDRDQARAAWREAVELYRQQGRDEDASRVQSRLDSLDTNESTP
ncbi:SARP family transcriptional regulator [Kutzneria sp. CA-103260]|nr:SARP family transcriptional regulator [Kutzneria sp. CA-103260]